MARFVTCVPDMEGSIGTQLVRSNLDRSLEYSYLQARSQDDETPPLRISLSSSLELSNYVSFIDTSLDRPPSSEQLSCPPWPLVLSAQREHLDDHTPWSPVGCIVSQSPWRTRDKRRFSQ